jgi:hypothetical protein
VRAETKRKSQRPRRLGSETPRVFTPPLRELTPQTSLGFLAIQFATEVLHLELFPWQRWLLIHLLELAPGLTVDTMKKRDRLSPLFRFRKVVILVARQNGKSTIGVVISLFCMYILRVKLVLGTAQDLDTAEEVWEQAVELVTEVDDDTDEPVRPDLAEMVKKVRWVNGKKSLDLIGKERYKVKTASRRGGRGLSGDLVLLDELREHQTWAAWSAITKTTNARPAAMVLGLSNAGDDASVVLRYLRLLAHKALGDPDGINALEDPTLLLSGLAGDEDEDDADELEDLAGVDDEWEWDTLGIFEWSAPPDCAKDDRDGWAQANPSLGHCISEATIASDCAIDPEWDFRTEVLCQWPAHGLNTVFPGASWADSQDPESRRSPDARVTAGVAVSQDRSRAYVGIAADRGDGTTHVEVVATRAGVEWILPWFLDDTKPHRAQWAITGQAKSAPVSPIMTTLAEAGLDVQPWEGSDLSGWWSSFYDGVVGLTADGENRPTIWHRPQQVLDVAVTVAETRRLGDARVLDRQKSGGDIGALECVVAAHGLQTTPTDKPAPEPRIRILGGRR